MSVESDPSESKFEKNLKKYKQNLYLNVCKYD